MTSYAENNPDFLIRALDNAIAQQRFEGLLPSKEVIEDLKHVINGQLTIDDVIANIGRRYHDAQIFGQ